jgi:hypothetical protein
MTEKNPRARVSLTFLQGKDADLQKGGKSIVAGMRDNPELPNPPVNLTEFDALLDSYNDAITACVDGGKLATATRNSLREEVTKAVRLLAAYVESLQMATKQLFVPAVSTHGYINVRSRNRWKLRPPSKSSRGIPASSPSRSHALRTPRITNSATASTEPIPQHGEVRT